MTDRDELDDLIDEIHEEMFGEMELIARQASTRKMPGDVALRTFVQMYREASKEKTVTVLYPAGTSVH